MGWCGDNGRAATLSRLSVVAFGCLTLANCSSGTHVSKLDPKLGVSASPRVVEPGQPIPKGTGVYRVGRPYVVAGRTYVPEENNRYRAEGLASWYGDDFHGRLTANREIYDMNAISAAHPTLPMPSYARVTNLANGRSLVVRVNDRGPYHANREIDLSRRAAELLGYRDRGTTRVRVEYVGAAPIEGTDDRQLAATLREGEPAPAPSGVRVASRSLFGDIPFRSSPVIRSGTPTPQERPYDLGQDDRAPAEPAPALRTRTFEARSPSIPLPARAALSDPPGTAPVSAYAPIRQDGSQALTTGRGLY